MINIDNKIHINYILVDDDLDWMQKFKELFENEQYSIFKSLNREFKIEILSISEMDSYQIEARYSQPGQISPPPNPAECLLKDLSESKPYTGYTQGILLDWELNVEPEKLELINKIKGIRKELPIYIITSNPDGFKILEETKGMVDDFFYKPQIESDIVSIIRRLYGAFKKRASAPFWDAYKDYVEDSIDTWHTPGHSGGTSFRISKYISDFYSFFGDGSFKGDLSVSVDKLGSLLDSTEYIKAAQNKAASTFGAKKTYFVTNGSSTANKIIIQTLLRPGEHVIVDRNCHKSVHYGVIQSGAIPHFLDSSYSSKYGIFAPPSIENIKQTIDNNPSAKLLILTGCTYDGILTDLEPIVKLCHKQGIKVMIDEAWFAYSRFHPRYNKYSAVESGADYVTHSSHKTLSAFSQASMIHVNDSEFDEDYFREVFYIYTSTSPHYQIIASLDVAAVQMEMEGFKLLTETIQLAQVFRKNLKELQKFKVVESTDFFKEFDHLESEQMGFDILKVLIDFSSTGLSKEQILNKIRNLANLEIEKSTHSTFLVLFTIGTEKGKAERLYNALKVIDEQPIGRYKTQPINLPNKIELDIVPFNAFTGKREKIIYTNAEGKISAGLVTPYPPGIPFLMPGQKINQDHIDYITKDLIPNNVEVHGLFDGEIYVVLNEEEN